MDLYVKLAFTFSFSFDSYIINFYMGRICTLIFLCVFLCVLMCVLLYTLFKNSFPYDHSIAMNSKQSSHLKSGS